MDDNSEWAYHITYARNLPAIAQDGLDPKAQTGLSAPGYLGHSKNKTFFTDYEGIAHWYWEAEQGAENQSDDVYSDAMVPVVLAFPWPQEFIEDEASGYESAYYTQEPIDAEEIVLWDGADWWDVQDVESVDLAQAIDFEQEDGEDLAYFKPQYLNPLVKVVELA